MKAKDLEIGTRVSKKLNGRLGTVIGNKLSDGDEVVAVEWNDGSLTKANVNDLENRAIELAYELIQEKMIEAAAALNAARILASDNHTSLSSLYYNLDFSAFFDAMDDAGWSTSSMHC